MSSTNKPQHQIGPEIEGLDGMVSSRDHSCPTGRILVREEYCGEIHPYVLGQCLHLNREFAGRSIFFGSGIGLFIDPESRFLILSDSSVALLFDYETGATWSARRPWRCGFANLQFLHFDFMENALLIYDPNRRLTHDSHLLIGKPGYRLPHYSFSQFFNEGLGASADGYLTHWRYYRWEDRIRAGKSFLL